MTYNTAPRRRFTAQQRAAFLARHDCRCWWCSESILPGQPWDIEHKTAREMLPDASADADENLAPIHSHPAECHKIKSRADKAMIAKSNRVRVKHGLQESRRKRPKPKMRSRPMPKGQKTNWPKRPFSKRGRDA